MKAITRATIFLIVFCLLPAAEPGAAQSRGPKKHSDAGPIVLRGTVVAPAGAMKHAELVIRDGRFEAVSEERPDLPGALTVNTHAILVPGFIDVHNHVPWNVLPRWSPGRLFANRNQWRADEEYLQTVDRPFSRVAAAQFCDMNAWGELRALVGGTTSILATRKQSCIHGLVRNLDWNSGFYGTTELHLEHVHNEIDLPPASRPDLRAMFVAIAHFAFLGNPRYEALFLHLAEGTDEAALEELDFVESQSLLDAKGVVVHGIPLGAADFQAMALAGTALVWSPRSNLELYGATADVEAALDAGVDIALAPDWAITGSGNLLDELAVAARWNRDRLGGRLSDRRLVEMVTAAPARIAGIDDEVGSIAVGLRADLLVIDGDHNDPYAAIVGATPADVQLVLVDGVPIYGDRRLMERFWARSDLEEIQLPGGAKTLATPAAGFVAAQLETRLSAALEAEGTTLAPLTAP